ncbi:ImmA/IrrE family metallo-endopeptidase [Aquihabitans daechungensis]|uniref:ImmA/IrrE family metallo-endopeptidase n=1 Tax=Aquihabitans daechungensis TaxID=1052257 RepID=UPI003BA20F23
MDRWNPWAALRATSIELWFAPLQGERGRWTRRREGDEILLDESLDRQARQEVLAHELVHAERGVGWPHATPATMEVEEERVWRIALRRLVPPAQITRFLTARGTVGPVTIADLAEEFDLSPDAAARVAHLYAVSGGSADDDA